VLRVWLKFAFGLVLMGCGFMLLALNARHGAAEGQASMGMMVAGLALMGFAELFIDPVAMAQITPQYARRHRGTDRDLYAGDRRGANWLAGVVAQQTTESQISDTAIAAYQHFFAQMGEWTLGCVAVIVVVAFAAAFSVGKRRAVNFPAAAPVWRQVRLTGATKSCPGSPAKAFTPQPGIGNPNSGATSRSLHRLLNRRRIFWQRGSRR
jgi:MFS family permease